MYFYPNHGNIPGNILPLGGILTLCLGAKFAFLSTIKCGRNYGGLIKTELSKYGNRAEVEW